LEKVEGKTSSLSFSQY